MFSLAPDPVWSASIPPPLERMTGGPPAELLAAALAHRRAASRANETGNQRIEIIRREIADGTYVTDAKLDVVCERLHAVLRKRSPRRPAKTA